MGCLTEIIKENFLASIYFGTGKGSQNPKVLEYF